MELALILSAFMLGLAGTPHCAAMCGASCAGVLQGCASGADTRSTALAFHAARVAGYAAAGALAAAGVGVLALAGSAAPLVRPIWTLLHVAALALGLWLLMTGRQPAFMTRAGRSRSAVPAAAGNGWQTMSGPVGGAAAGAAWVAWPCGLLQSALVVAALANNAQGGAAAMAAFAIASATGLQLAPWMMARLGGTSGSPAFAVRIAGGALAAGSAWAMGHDLWGRVVAYCTT